MICVKNLVLIAALALLSGCVSFTATPINVALKKNPQTLNQEIDKLIVSCGIFNNTDIEAVYLGRPISPEGFYAVVLYLENTGEEAFLIRQESIHLHQFEGQSYCPANVQEVYEGARFSKGSALLGLPFGLFPALIISNGITHKNTKYLQDLQSKSFHDIRLSPDQRKFNSVLFFKLAEGSPPPTAEKIILSLEIEKEGTPAKAPEHLHFRLVPNVIQH